MTEDGSLALSSSMLHKIASDVAIASTAEVGTVSSFKGRDSSSSSNCSSCWTSESESTKSWYREGREVMRLGRLCDGFV